jgi:taurine dioxygenase
MTSTLPTRRLQPYGVEVGLDLRDGLSDDEASRLRGLYREHYLLVFRQQGILTREEQSRVLALLGPITDDGDEVPVVSNSRPDGVLGADRLMFHSDHEYCPSPGLGISLHAIDVADGQTSTLFANGVAAYRRLNQVTKERLSGLTASHVLSTDYTVRDRNWILDQRWPHAVHPVVMSHPDTGAPILYVTELQTFQILGLASEESDALLAELFAALYAPTNIYEHYWSTGDLVIWDNRALQHARKPVGDVPRTLQRISLGKGIVSQWPEFIADYEKIEQEILTPSARSPSYR